MKHVSRRDRVWAEADERQAVDRHHPVRGAGFQGLGFSVWGLGVWVSGWSLVFV